MDLKKSPKIISVGELLVEFIPEEPFLKIREEGKIFKTASGSSGIFACANAKICDRAAFIGKIGKDPLSSFVYEVMKREGVDVSHVAVADEGQIGLSFVENLENGRNFEYYRKDSAGSKFSALDLDREYIQSASAIHYSGMLLEVSEEMRSACQKCVEYAKSAGVLVSFDPNIRKEVGSNEAMRRRLLEAVKSADIISPTLEEARFITGLQDPREILKKLHAMGPEVVALTMDREGAIVSRGGISVTASGIDLPPIDPTGAGDTFASMLVYGVLENWGLEKIALYCNCAGTLAVTKQGSIGRALPSMQEVEELARTSPCRIKTERWSDR